MIKVKVDQNLCIGCGTCLSICPKTFRINGHHKSEPIEPAGDPEEKIQEAVDACPIQAISTE